MSLEADIARLKKERNALILAHYYQEAEIQEIADKIGDSYFLAAEGQKSSADVIVLAGVVFMAESVKILNPAKKVLVPDLEAGCSLVSGTPYQAYKNWRLQYPDGIAVTYINSSAEVKSVSDVICTSSNAEKIIAAIPKHRPILFGPDRNLGRFLEKKTGRQMVLWPGACEVHVLFSAQKLFELKMLHPDAAVLAHPECEEGVLAYADVIGSTSKLLEQSKVLPHKKFIIATEDGIIHQMKKGRPDAEFIQAPDLQGCSCNQCPYMKKNSLEKIRDALQNLKPEVYVPEKLMEEARIPLQRMMDITAGKPVEWPREPFTIARASV
ncbi:MAG TPA: quinolinate synthase NadA [Bdellovibrionales bacterium]|nr:quinolinate synthase NadA [Bdellovibrionales bacterium]